MRGRSLGIASISIFLLIFAFACSKGTESRERGNASMAPSVEIREPAVAGAFYPGTESALRKNVEQLLSQAKPPVFKGKVIGLISPHAGYIYSGLVAAHGYKLIKGTRFDDVIIVAPSHHAYFKGSSIYFKGPYRTPLGLVDVDRALCKAIVDFDESIIYYPQAHFREHSLEVQLPFLQIALDSLRIVPIVMGDQAFDNCVRLAEAIASNVKDRNVLLVASSDLSHYHNYDEAVSLDNIVIDHVSRYDYEGLAKDLERRVCEACGGGPIITVMIAAQKLGATKSVILKYANSGDVTGDRSTVVGYLSAALISEKKGDTKSEKSTETKGESRSSTVGVDLGLGDAEKIELLKIARLSIEAKVKGKPIPEFHTDLPLLKAKMGAFVTLTKNGQLRGCIGNIRGTMPLYQTVSQMAIAAATEDPRFPPVRADELKDITIEISVLTPFKRLTDPEEIQIGRDGLYIEKGHHHGLLLPQVATEYGWDREEFLKHTCLKAGLPPDAWKEGSTLYSFSAQVFNETELGLKP